MAAGANINSVGTRGRSVAVWSSHIGSPLTTKLLLESGADWAVRDNDGVSVAEAELHFEYDQIKEPEKAAAHDWILKFLAEKGVDMKAAEEKSRELYQKNFRAKPGEIKVFDKLPEGIKAGWPGRGGPSLKEDALVKRDFGRFCACHVELGTILYRSEGLDSGTLV